MVERHIDELPVSFETEYSKTNSALQSIENSLQNFDKKLDTLAARAHALRNIAVIAAENPKYRLHLYSIEKLGIDIDKMTAELIKLQRFTRNMVRYLNLKKLELPEERKDDWFDFVKWAKLRNLYKRHGNITQPEKQEFDENVNPMAKIADIEFYVFLKRYLELCEKGLINEEEKHVVETKEHYASNATLYIDTLMNTLGTDEYYTIYGASLTKEQTKNWLSRENEKDRKQKEYNQPSMAKETEEKENEHKD